MSALAPTLQAFFTDRLVRQRQASPHTLAAYRDTMRLLVRFATARRGVEPSKLDIGDLDAPLISAFLDHREHDQGNSIRTRNARLAAIRSLFRFAALRHPEHAAVIGRVLAIPPKRFERRLVTFLTEPEIDALLAAPARTTWTGRRDHTLLALAVQTGLRVSELIALRKTDVHLGVGPHVSCLGKGRKQRITPLTAPVVAVLRRWLLERAGQENDPLFPTRTGRTLSRDALEHRLRTYVATAVGTCPSLREKTITLHVLRHYLYFLTMSSDQDRCCAQTENLRPNRRGRAESARHSLRGADDLQAVEKAEELIRWSIPGQCAVRWCGLGERLFFHGQRGLQIDLGGFHGLVPEPQGDHGAIDTGVE